LAGEKKRENPARVVAKSKRKRVIVKKRGGNQGEIGTEENTAGKSSRQNGRGEQGRTAIQRKKREKQVAVFGEARKESQNRNKREGK